MNKRVACLLLGFLCLLGGCASQQEAALSPQDLYGVWIPQGQSELLALEFLSDGRLLARYSDLTATGAWQMQEGRLSLRFVAGTREFNQSIPVNLQEGALELGEGETLQRYVRAPSPAPVDYP